MTGPDKRTIFARRNRDPYSEYTACRLPLEQLERLRQVAKMLYIDVSDLLRALIAAIASLPVKQEVSPQIAPLPTSDKIRYV